MSLELKKLTSQRQLIYLLPNPHLPWFADVIFNYFSLIQRRLNGNSAILKRGNLDIGFVLLYRKLSVQYIYGSAPLYPYCWMDLASFNKARILLNPPISIPSHSVLPPSFIFTLKHSFIVVLNFFRIKKYLVQYVQSFLSLKMLSFLFTYSI